MFRIRIIGTLVAIVVVLTCLLIQFGTINQTQLSAAQSGNQKAVAGKETAEEAPQGEDLTTVDVSDIVVKEHHWVENGYGVRWTPDGKYVVFCRKGGEFYVMDPLCQNVRHFGMYFEGMSPDGKFVYGTRLKEKEEEEFTEGIFAINVEDGAVRQSDWRSINWSPDGKHLVVTLESEELALMNADGTGFKVLEGVDGGPEWSPDGKCAAVHLKSGEWALMNADSTGFKVLKGTFMKPWPDWSKPWPKWSPDGSKLLYETEDNSTYVVNADGSGATVIAKGQRYGWVGRTNKVWMRDKETKEVMIINADGTGAQTITQSDSPPKFSPSGAWVIYKDPEHTNWNILRIANGKKLKLLPEYSRYGHSDTIFWLPGEDRIIFPMDAPSRLGTIFWLPGEDCIIFPTLVPSRGLNFLITLEDTGAGRLLGSEEDPWDNLSLSPNSRFIAFIMRKPALLGIANADMTKANLLTEVTYGELVWSPFSNAIAYEGAIPYREGRVGVVILGRKGP